MTVILLYFTPSFGLFSTLGHWRMEQTPFAEKYRNQIEKAGTLYLYKTNITKEQWNKIDRYNYNTDNGPHYSEYTGCSLTEYFLYFWVIMFIHVIMNMLIKAATSRPFRNTPGWKPIFIFMSCPLKRLIRYCRWVLWESPAMFGQIR